MRTLTDRPLPSRALLVVLALVAVFLPTGGAAQAAPGGSAPAGGTPAAVGTATGATVTLVTGDKVTLGPEQNGSPTVRFQSRHGGDQSTGDGFRVMRRRDGVYVIPDDVVRLVPGVLDAALFNVTALVATGYDDAHRKDVPLIVKRADGVRALSAGAVGLRRQRSLDSIGADASDVTKTDAARFGDALAGMQTDRVRGVRAAAPLDDVRKVWLDGRVSAADLDGYLSQVKAPSAWASKLDGAGVPVAVLDTGVDDGHPDLSGKVTEAQNFTDSPTVTDVEGHGTHVASVIAGTGAKADGARRGIAYGAPLISAKVLGDDRFGQESWVIAGMQWAVAQGAKVVNMSLGAAAADTDDPVAQALDELTASSGALFVVAAGNTGWTGYVPFMIESPGIAASALTVGAVGSNGMRASFSSEGPVRGSYRLKPDVAAPGVDILGARAGARDGDFYRSLSGTSQATPIVAGAAALLLQQHPDWSWQRVKAAIVDTADRSVYDGAWASGGGCLDLARATTEPLTSSVPSVDFGFLHYPATKPVSTQVTLTNSGSAARTVTLTDEEKRQDGQPAAADGVTVSPGSLTVPAGGSASATVTVDPSAVADGMYQGTLTVAAGDQPDLRLPIGFYDEPEHYDLSVRVLDRNGDPYANGSIWLVDGDTGNGYFDYPLDADGRARLHLVPGHWAVFSTVTTPASGDRPETTTVGGTAELHLDRDLSYVLDARKAVRMRPPEVTGQQTTATEFNFTYGKRADNGVGLGDAPVFTLADVRAGKVFVLPSGSATVGQLYADVRWRLEPTGHVRPGTPDSYELLYARHALGSELWPAISRHDVSRMARLDETVPAIGGPASYALGQAYTIDGTTFIYYRPITVPAHRTAVFTAAPDAQWYQCLVFPAQPLEEMCDQSHSYRPGSRHTTTWATGLHPAVHAARHDPDWFSVETGVADMEHTGVPQPDAVESARLVLYRDGERIGESAYPVAFFPVPDGAADFRLEQSYTLSAGVLSVARQANTTWTFHSVPHDYTEPTSVPPILDLGYASPVDSLGRARARHPLPVTLTVRHLTGATPPVSAVRSAELSYSVDDGATWHRLYLVRTGTGTWRTLVPGRALRPGTSVSVRAHASDAAGGTVDQTVLGMTPVV